MSTFTTVICQTKELYDYCVEAFDDGYRAQKRAKTYFEGANDYMGHNVIVNTPDNVPSAPTEYIDDTFETTYPCDSSFTVSYDNLTYWWKDLVSCGLGESEDCDLLLTNSEDSNRGYAADSQYAVAEGGGHIANLPSSHDIYGCISQYDAMETALHEFAHCVLEGGTDGFNEHAVGYTYDRGNDDTETMMTNETIGQENECGEYVNEPNCFEMRWSDCCESKMKHT